MFLPPSVWSGIPKTGSTMVLLSGLEATLPTKLATPENLSARDIPRPCPSLAQSEATGHGVQAVSEGTHPS